MDDFIREYFRKKGIAQYAPEMVAEADGVDYEVAAPEGGTVRVTREPLRPAVRQSMPGTVSGDDNDERKQLGASVEERAALNDPRASASFTDSRRHFTNSANKFLALAGLPQTQATNPYADERDRMRQWLLQKKQAGDRSEANALNADRTKAYLDATQAARERDLAAQTLRAEQEGRKADAEKYRRELDAERGKREQERIDLEARRVKVLEDQAKRKGAPKPTGPKLSPKGFPAGWELEGNTQPTPRQGEQFEGLVYSSEKMRGLTAQMRKMLGEAGAGRVLPGEAKSRMSQLAKEIQIEGKNIAELGALSGPDYALMEAIAADPTKVDSYIKDMPALLDGLDKWGDNSVSAKAKALGARRVGAAPKSAASGRVTVTNGTETMEIDADDLADAEREGFKVVR